MVCQRLDGHIEGTADGVLLFEDFVILKTVSKPEIAELESSILQQNVRRLDVPVHYAVLG